MSSQCWGYNKMPKNWKEILQKEYTEDEKDKIDIIVSKIKSGVINEKPKINPPLIGKPKIHVEVSDIDVF